MRLQVLVVKDQQGRQAEINERNPQDKTRLDKTRHKDKNLCGKPAEGHFVYRSIPGIQLVMVMVRARVRLGYWKGKTMLTNKTKIG